MLENPSLDNLKLNRPIAFFDLETTGSSVQNDRIVEICIIKVHPDKSSEKLLERINPQMPISPEASEIHGIYEEDIKDKASFSELAQKISDFLSGCDIAGYNIRNFDLPIITKEFERAKTPTPFSSGIQILDPMRIFHKMERRDLSAAYQLYCGKELVNAHSSEADIKATMEVLNQQVSKYELDNDVNALADFCSYEDEKNCIDIACKFRKNKDGDVVFTFGTNKGKKIEDNLGMLKWMLDKDFSQDTKEHAKSLLKQHSKTAA